MRAKKLFLDLSESQNIETPPQCGHCGTINLQWKDMAQNGRSIIRTCRNCGESNKLWRYTVFVVESVRHQEEDDK